MTSRDQFEQAYAEDNGMTLLQVVEQRMASGSYRVPAMSRAWFWWQESRAAVVVKTVPDAGTAVFHIRDQKYGPDDEVYPCPAHTSGDCGMCGGTGFRAVCNMVHCHEHGCQGGCSRSEEDFQIQRSRAKRLA